MSMSERREMYHVRTQAEPLRPDAPEWGTLLEHITTGDVGTYAGEMLIRGRYYWRVTTATLATGERIQRADKPERWRRVPVCPECQEARDP